MPQVRVTFNNKSYFHNEKKVIEILREFPLLENFSLNFTSSSFLIRVNLLYL